MPAKKRVPVYLHLTDTRIKAKRIKIKINPSHHLSTVMRSIHPQKKTNSKLKEIIIKIRAPRQSPKVRKIWSSLKKKYK